MAFQSVEYLLFLLVLLGTYFWLPRAAQNGLLLAASYVFYGWIHPWYVLLIGVHTLVDYSCGRLIGAARTRARKRLFLTLSLLTSFSILAVFKYLGFFTENITTLFAALGIMPAPWVITIALPAGISFFTFQSASYVIDVYRGRVEAERSLLDYADFVSFFPQLVAGPIERADNLLRQMCAPRRPGLLQIRSGFVLIVWGLFEKLVIADSAALIADKVFSLRDATFPVLWGGVLAFGVQIYADFSAYTDIARGSARLLGFELRENFNHPYLAQSLPDFWRRWHMSLSTWFRDYVYIPLGGSRGGAGRTARNLLITFFLSGLWHGASWNFVLWGIFHGVLVAGWPHLAHRWPILARSGGKPGAVFRVILTFALVHIGWLLFREHNIAMIGSGLTLNPLDAPTADWRMGAGLAAEALLYGLPLMALFPLAQKFRLVPRSDDERLLTWRWTFLQAATATLSVIGILALRCSVGSDFIYFQF
ncbi:MAG: MBOAT family O-acyltransferase [Verrucomicrobiales bacterium]